MLFRIRKNLYDTTFKLILGEQKIRKKNWRRQAFTEVKAVKIFLKFLSCETGFSIMWNLTWRMGERY
jgi:hypothetical protein